MKKQSEHTLQEYPGNQSAERTTGWERHWRIIASVFLIVHLLAIAASALSNPGPTSPFVARVKEMARPYLRATFLDHGYQFFAPDPGPTHLVQYEIVKSDGQMETGIFPDREKHFPRLRYHRWFMLAESMNVFASDIPNAEEFELEKTAFEQEFNRLKDAGDTFRAQQLRQSWDARMQQMNYSRNLADLLYTRVAHWLLEQHGGEQITLYSLRRHLPGPQEVNAGIKLNDPMFFDYPDGRRELIRYPLEELTQ